jgi:NADP-dependent 3-hydroxy acid dehydrogenase YdfG
MGTTKAVREFSAKEATAELARLRRRSRKLEQAATENLHRKITALWPALYDVRDAEELLNAVRRFEV